MVLSLLYLIHSALPQLALTPLALAHLRFLFDDVGTKYQHVCGGGC